jgi:RHS repeat-associated protein
VEADNRTYTMSRTYDSGNRPTSHTYPDGKATTWSYDSRNLVTNVAYEGEAVVSQTHDSAYRLTNQTLGNGLTRTINYSRQDNLRTSDITFDGNQSLDDLAFSYNYAADKQITAETIIGDVVQVKGISASYDAGNRLTGWSRDGSVGILPASATAQQWNYDNSGNWQSTTKTIAGNTTTESRNHSVSDQITSIAGNAAVHDEKGNLTEYEINSKEYAVTYDLENRITKVDVNNSDVEYRYDALGRQIIRKEGSTETALLWWGNSECAEYEHSAGQAPIQNDIMSHPTTLNSVIARAVEGSKFDLEWYHKNYLDHVYALSNDTGNLDEHYRYTAFGEVTIYNGSGIIQSSTQINNQILWNTRRLDTVSNYYLYKYRHYDPALGRWPSRDPIEENGGVNLYAFVGNNPVNLWDVLGLHSQDQWYGYDDGQDIDPEDVTFTADSTCKIPADAQNHHIADFEHKIEPHKMGDKNFSRRTRILNLLPTNENLWSVKVTVTYKICVFKNAKCNSVKWKKVTLEAYAEELGNTSDYSISEEHAKEHGMKLYQMLLERI